MLDSKFTPLQFIIKHNGDDEIMRVWEVLVGDLKGRYH